MFCYAAQGEPALPTTKVNNYIKEIGHKDITGSPQTKDHHKKRHKDSTSTTKRTSQRAHEHDKDTTRTTQGHHKKTQDSTITTQPHRREHTNTTKTQPENPQGRFRENADKSQAKKTGHESAESTHTPSRPRGTPTQHILKFARKLSANFGAAGGI